MKRILTLLAALPLTVGLLSAQDSVGIPNDVFYLMPKMTQGTLLFRDKSPIPGQFNICAVDNTVRFMDKGTELAMEDDDSMLEVVFNDVAFLHRDGTYYRLYPATDEAFVAVRRDVLIENGISAASPTRRPRSKPGSTPTRRSTPRTSRPSWRCASSGAGNNRLISSHINAERCTVRCTSLHIMFSQSVT